MLEVTLLIWVSSAFILFFLSEFSFVLVSQGGLSHTAEYGLQEKAVMGVMGLVKDIIGGDLTLLCFQQFSRLVACPPISFSRLLTSLISSCSEIFYKVGLDFVYKKGLFYYLYH